MARKRNHPLVQIVVWLGVALVACLFLLVIVVSDLPAADVLERTFMDGMAEGNALCGGR